jgi:Arc/MetJ family transcription regulator
MTDEDAMRKEYDLQTDVLATIVATTPVTAKHAALQAAFATRTGWRGARYVMTRDTYSEWPARVIDREGREVAPDYGTWIDAQLAQHSGSVSAVVDAHRESGYLLTEIQPLLHYFVHDRGGAQDNFAQFAVWEQQEYVERAVFPSETRWGLPDAGELRRAAGNGMEERIERRTLGAPRYALMEAIDMQ